MAESPNTNPNQLRDGELPEVVVRQIGDVAVAECKPQRVPVVLQDDGYRHPFLQPPHIPTPRENPVVHVGVPIAF